MIKVIPVAAPLQAAYIKKKVLTKNGNKKFVQIFIKIPKVKVICQLR